MTLTATLAGSPSRIHFAGVHLRDRGRRDRFAETEEQLVDRPAERTFDGGDGLGHRKGFHAILQQGEVERDVVADDVGPRRQELAELDVGRAEPGDGSGQPVAAAAPQGTPLVKSRAIRQPNFGRPESWSPGSAATTPSRTMIQPARTSLSAAPTSLMPNVRRGVRQSFQPECSAAMPPE